MLACYVDPPAHACCFCPPLRLAMLACQCHVGLLCCSARPVLLVLPAPWACCTGSPMPCWLAMLIRLPTLA
eukprot:255806-Chlamydomonas_euryale.AAC.1